MKKLISLMAVCCLIIAFSCSKEQLPTPEVEAKTETRGKFVSLNNGSNFLSNGTFGSGSVSVTQQGYDVPFAQGIYHPQGQFYIEFETYLYDYENDAMCGGNDDENLTQIFATFSSSVPEDDFELEWVASSGTAPIFTLPLVNNGDQGVGIVFNRATSVHFEYVFGNSVDQTLCFVADYFLDFELDIAHADASQVKPSNGNLGAFKVADLGIDGVHTQGEDVLLPSIASSGITANLISNGNGGVGGTVAAVIIPAAVVVPTNQRP